jgi:hypothetical protein
MTTKDGLRVFLDDLVKRYREAEDTLPTAPWDPDVAPWFWQGPPNEEEWAPWKPLEKTEYQDVRRMAPELAQAHASVDEYYNSWWFSLIEGAHRGHSITLDAVLPGLHPIGFVKRAQGFRRARAGREGRVPVGIEANGLIVVVDNGSGAVGLEDHETGVVHPLAPSLGDLLVGMTR